MQFSHAYFCRREGLWANILRDQEMPYTKDDLEVHEADDGIMGPIFAHWERMKETLAEGWKLVDGPTQPLFAAIGLALDFQTWRTMTRKQSLSDHPAIELMVGMVRCALRR